MIFEITQVIKYPSSFFRSLYLIFLLVPVYILAVFSVILVICFISFFHCEYRRQKKDEIEHNAAFVHTDSEDVQPIE